jgi:hypothetical protein
VFSVGSEAAVPRGVCAENSGAMRCGALVFARGATREPDAASIRSLALRVVSLAARLRRGDEVAWGVRRTACGRLCSPSRRNRNSERIGAEGWMGVNGVGWCVGRASCVGLREMSLRDVHRKGFGRCEWNFKHQQLRRGGPAPATGAGRSPWGWASVVGTRAPLVM